MKKTKAKSQASLVSMCVVGFLDKHPDLTDCFNAFEKTLKQYAKLHSLDIRASVQVWEIK